MRIYIEIEDLVANALIELVEKKGQRNVLFSQLDEYGAKVVDVLNKEYGTPAMLVVTRESQRALVDDYTEFFKPFCDDAGALGISLREDKEPIDLWSRFCASFSARLNSAFQEKQVVNVLGVNG